MAEQSAVLETIAILEAMRAEARALERAQPEGWKHRYLSVRRELPAQLGRINEAANEWLAAQGDTTDGRHLRELLRRIRGLIAEHQTRWPVVTIAAGDPAFNASMANLDAARDELLEFARTRMSK